MDELTLWKIRYKYKNKIFPRLAYLLINFLNDNHLNYLNLILSKYIKIDDIIYFLKFRDITNEDDLIIDPFGGLGTTMIACIKNKRRCCSIELQPFYCEKTIERYLDFVVGKPNVKIIRGDETIPYEKIRELCKKDQYSLFDF